MQASCMVVEEPFFTEDVSMLHLNKKYVHFISKSLLSVNYVSTQQNLLSLGR
jgi:hypothetical protein